jgi:mannose-1-phosphate guanylyltransferase
MTSATAPISGFYAVLAAGGPGSRLWPLSRTNRPKFLLDLTGSGQSLLQQTWDRLSALAEPDHIVVVTGSRHADAVAGQLPELAPSNLLREPTPRDTAPAICLAAAVLARRSPDAVIGAFPADHVITDVAAFHSSVREAVATAHAGYVVTIGIEPTFPSTAFGYAQLGEPLRVAGAPNALSLCRFVEKPDADTAAKYLAEGNWRWNAGMFVARASVLLAELEHSRPAMHEAISEVADAWDTPRQSDVVAEIWPTIEKISIDYAVAEPATASGRVAVIPAGLGWDDVGDWAALVGMRAPEDGSQPAVLGDVSRVFASDTTGLVVAAGGRAVTVHGLDDIVVVDTDDVVLVTTRQRAQEVKRLVEELRRRGEDDLT